MFAYVPLSPCGWAGCYIHKLHYNEVSFRAAYADPVLPKVHAYMIVSAVTRPAASPELPVLPAALIIRKLI